MIDLPLPILGSYFKLVDRSKAGDIATTVNPLLEPNPQRWAVYFWNPGDGATVLRVHPLILNQAIGGDDLVAGTTYRLFTFSQMGALVQCGWGFEVNPLNDHIGCFEILYQPPAMSSGMEE